MLRRVPIRMFFEALPSRTENDVFHCVECDVHFVRDVRLRRVMCLRAWVEYITSLCGNAAKHHCAARQNITCPTGQTSLSHRKLYIISLLATV